ncbi:MAG: cupin domain-containing protein [Planctomycetota bacterium]|jgi:uncharacterized cupin superfamily protein
MEHYRVDFKSMPWQTPAIGVRCKSYEHNDRKLRFAEFSREFTEPDWCTKGHIGYILDGRVEIDFDGEVVVFEAGDGLFIPAGQEHKHKGNVLTDVVRLLLVEDTQSSVGEQ